MTTPGIFSDRSLYPVASRARFWRAAFLVVLVLYCSPFWIFKYFPSQDGPSHLHNASVLANYGTELIYQQYYRLTPFQPAGNMLTQFMLAAFIKVTGPIVAEKLLLSLYAILFFVSFRYLLRTLTPYADHFAVFAGVLVSNWFFYMGFWNFVYSICVLLFTIGYYVRHQNRWVPLSLIVLGVAGLILYLTHSLSWIVGVTAVVILGAESLLSIDWRRPANRTMHNLRRPIAQYVLPVGSLLPPVLLMLLYLATSKESLVLHHLSLSHSSLKASIWSLGTLSFLRATTGDKVVAIAIAAILIIMLIYIVGAALWHGQYSWRSVNFLVASATFAAISVAGPDSVGTELFLRERLGLYAFLFFVVWLAVQNWPRTALVMIPRVFCSIAVIAFFIRLPVLAQWDLKLAHFVDSGQNIERGSTALGLSMDWKGNTVGLRDINPYLHAVGLLAPRVVIDLGNYEALLDYFSTKFQAERSPSPALGTLSQLQEKPPVFDIIRYEKKTEGHVDYVFFTGEAESHGNGKEWLEVTLYKNQLAGYKLLSAEPGGEVRVYARASREADHVSKNSTSVVMDEVELRETR